MPYAVLPFDALPWQPGNHPLERKKLGLLGGATLLRFEPGFQDPNWCTNGHVAYVLEGMLRLQLRDTVLDVLAGQGFVLDPGEAHRASNPGFEPVVLFIAPRGDTPQP